MAIENRGPGRPPKNPTERFRHKASILLTDHQQRVLDALVADSRRTQHRATQPDFLRDLIKAEYKRRVAAGMTPVPRDG